MAAPPFSGKRLRFGKYKNRYLHEIPADYIAWIRREVPLYDDLADEMERVWGGTFRRKSDWQHGGYQRDWQPGGQTRQRSIPGITPESLRKVQRELAIKHHPDLAGGDPAVMKGINLAFDALRDATTNQQPQ